MACVTQRTLRKLMQYNIRQALFNLADAWQEVTVLTLANGWERLLYDMDGINEFAGFEPDDFLKTMRSAGEKDVSEDDVVQWLEMDLDDPGYHHLTEEEIVASVLEKDEVVREEEEINPGDKVKLSDVRRSADDILLWLDQSQDPEAQKYYCHLRELRALVIREQHASPKQFRIHDFFKPMSK